VDDDGVQSFLRSSNRLKRVTGRLKIVSHKRTAAVLCEVKFPQTTFHSFLFFHLLFDGLYVNTDVGEIYMPVELYLHLMQRPNALAPLKKRERQKAKACLK